MVISVSSRDFDASRTSNAMFDELVERSLMSPLAGTKHTHVTLAIIIQCKMLALFSSLKADSALRSFFSKFPTNSPVVFILECPPPPSGVHVASHVFQILTLLIATKDPSVRQFCD